MQEEVCLYEYGTVLRAGSERETCFYFYNTERLKEALCYRPPFKIYHGREHHITLIAVQSMHLKPAYFVS
jgi:hypothetical protein